MADANLFSQYLKPVRSMQSYSDEMDKSDADKLTLQNQRGVNALQALTQRTQQQGFDDDQAVRQATIASGGDQNALLKALNAGGQYKASQTLQKTLLDNQKTKSEIGLSDAHAGRFVQETATGTADAAYKAATHHADGLAYVKTPADVTTYIDQGIAKGIFPAAARDQMLERAASFPSVDAWREASQQAAVPVLEQFKTAADTARNAATNATSVSNNTANNVQSGLNNTATNATHVQTTGMTNATSRANNASTQAGENNRAGLLRSNQLTIAGLDPQGNILGGGAQGGGLDGIVKGIGTGQVPLATALARMPAGIKAQVLAKVAEQYPDYDPTDMAQRSRAAVAFGTGPQGNSVRSFNVSLSHLDTLGNLADALNNGNMQLVNKVGNIFTQQTGSPAPTNFEAAKKIVTDEIVKAIVGSGGGVHDREAAAETIGKASSPAQLAGVIKTYKELMVGQLGGLERQYQATTGRADFKTKFLSPEAKAVQSGGAPDIHSAADAILGRK